MAVQLALELRDTPIKVNTVSPGYTATDLNGNSGRQTLGEVLRRLSDRLLPQAMLRPVDSSKQEEWFPGSSAGMLGIRRLSPLDCQMRSVWRSVCHFSGNPT